MIFIYIYLLKYLTSYHLIKGLNSDFLSVTSIIKNSRKLFQQELKGCRLLFPDYIISIFRFLPKIFSCNIVCIVKKKKFKLYMLKQKFKTIINFFPVNIMYQ